VRDIIPKWCATDKPFSTSASQAMRRRPRPLAVGVSAGRQRPAPFL
jgi:hypothetical protein